MAKQYIYPTPNPDGSNADTRLELHWQRDGGVQLATAAWQGEAGKPDTVIEYLPVDDKGETFRAWDGQFLDLNRQQINHLIRQLRNARDQAYGRDE